MTSDRPPHGSRLGVHHRAVGGDAAGVFMRELGAMTKAQAELLVQKIRLGMPRAQQVVSCEFHKPINEWVVRIRDDRLKYYTLSASFTDDPKGLIRIHVDGLERHEREVAN